MSSTKFYITKFDGQVVRSPNGVKRRFVGYIRDRGRIYYDEGKSRVIFVDRDDEEIDLNIPQTASVYQFSDFLLTSVRVDETSLEFTAPSIIMSSMISTLAHRVDLALPCPYFRLSYTNDQEEGVEYYSVDDFKTKDDMMKLKNTMLTSPDEKSYLIFIKAFVDFNSFEEFFKTFLTYKLDGVELSQTNGDYDEFIQLIL